MSNTKYACPECGSNIVAWADLDAQVSFDVTANGNFVNEKIENVFQSDGRCGVHCSNCEWEMPDNLDDEHPFVKLANQALKQQREIELLSAKQD